MDPFAAHTVNKFKYMIFWTTLISMKATEKPVSCMFHSTKNGNTMVSWHFFSDNDMLIRGVR